MHPRSAARDVSQLRSVSREAGVPDAPMPLAKLVADVREIARVLSEPRTMVARSTGRARLLAIQRFICTIGPTVGVEPEETLRALDASLPAGATRAWHRTGILIAGTTGRRRRGPSLGLLDLQRIVEMAAYDDDIFRTARDRALVALHCFSGLRPGEIAQLRWADLVADASGSGGRTLTATVERNGVRVALPILGPAMHALVHLTYHAGGTTSGRQGPVFRATEKRPEPISYRAVRKIVVRACARAGLPCAEAVSLRAAFAYSLCMRGLSEHEVAAMLGIVRVRTVDALIHPHQMLSAQLRVRESLV